MIIIFIGPPGCGKGTQAEILSKELNIPHVSPGELLRDRAKLEDEHGKKIMELLATGCLLPASIVNLTVIDALLHFKNCIIDGYPRNIEQAEFLEKHVNKDKIVVIYFDIDEEIVAKRISGRFQCQKCLKMYNKFFYPTKVEGVCDVCLSKEFIKRYDDNKDVLNARLKTYKESTIPVVEYYKDLVYAIKADDLPENIALKIKTIIENKKLTYI